MSTLIVKKLVGTDVVLDDLGLTIVGAIGTEFDLMSEDAENVSLSTDTVAAITAGDLQVLDPRDNTTVLSTADAILAIQNHNLTHFGISGGRFNDLDAPGTTPINSFLLDYNSSTDQYEQIDPVVVVSNTQEVVSAIVGGMLEDGGDTNVVYNPTNTPLIVGQDETDYDGTAPNGTFTGGDGDISTSYTPGDTITMSDGSVITVDVVDVNGDVTNFTVTTPGGSVIPGAPITQVSTTGSGILFALTPENPNIQQGSIQVNVDDSFLRNDGDTLDSGTLTVASGAAINIANGGDLTIVDPPVNPTDAVNKAYVDSVAQGLDAKQSVQAGTAAALTIGVAVSEWAYTNNGGVGDTLTNNTASTTTIDGILLEDGDRVLIKDQADLTQNGIYVVSGADAGSPTVLTRAADQDGSPGSEVSAGNFTYVENGTVNGSTGWVTQGDGQLNLNTDDIDWVQMSGAGTFTAGEGLSLTGSVFALDVSTLTTDTITLTDELPFGDTSGGDDNKTSVADFLADLNIVTSGGVGGFAVETAPNVYTNRTLVVNGLGPLDGLAVTDGNGVDGNPTFGLDIQNLPVQTDVDATNDRVAVWDSSANANVYYTVAEIAGSVDPTNSFVTWAGAGNTTGDNNIVADNSTDSVILSGGDGVNVDFTSSTNTVTLSFTRAGMTDTAVEATDTIAFFDGSNGDEPEYRSFSDMLQDLDVPNNVGAGTGILVKTGDAPDTYTTRAVEVSVLEDEVGLSITNGDGIAGNPTFGLDIVGLTDPAEDMAATDEFAVHNKSEGTGGANRKITGQDIADGVETILGIEGITISTINGQPILTITDTTRSKQLSTDSVVFTWGENQLSNLDWMQIGGNATDADSGFIMPMDGTVVYASGHCENTTSNSKDIHLFIDGVDQGSLGLLAGGANAEFVDNTVDFNFTQGQKLRLRAVGAGTGTIQDTVASVFVKWRA